MNPFDLLRTLAHVKALQADWEALLREPSVAKFIADAKVVANELGLDVKIKEALAALNTKEST